MRPKNSNKVGEHGKEVSLKTRPASRGIAIGKAVVLHGRRAHFNKTHIPRTQVSTEVGKLEAALKKATRQLERLAISRVAVAAPSRQGVFEAQLLMISDETFKTDLFGTIRKELVSSQWAVRKVSDALSAIFRRAEDDHFREKALDIEDVAERILIALGASADLKLGRDSIIVANEIGPSIIAEMGRAKSVGVVAARGGWTSHGFILAREMGIPAVTGFSGALRRIDPGETLIVDGYLGRVIVNPSKETLRHYRLLASEERTPSASTERGGILKTLDGEEITLRANVDAAAGFATAKNNGAKGIGLYRSELMISHDGAFPSEAKQLRVYRSLGKAAGRNAARIRIFDVQIDRLMLPAAARETNPALGLRALRLMQEYPVELKRQLRALLKAAASERIAIILPMVSDVGEIIAVKELLKAERTKLRNQGLKVTMPSIGAMVEVPSAVLMADEIARACDFLCVGTNDLVQYTLAVDRDNQDVADHYRSVHPAVLRSIKHVAEVGARAGKPVMVCGEMAASPVYVGILIGLGVRELSMNPTSLDRVRFFVSGVAKEECQEVATTLLACESVEEAEEVLSRVLSSKWAELSPMPSLH